MIKHGKPPYLECSSRGDRRFSAMFARVESHGAHTVERLYQAMKIFGDGSTGLDPRNAKGCRPINPETVSAVYEELWRDYLDENPELYKVLAKASGLSDFFGQEGHQCQATTLWKLRSEYLERETTRL